MAGIARWCFRRRWVVIGLWLALLLLLGGINLAAGDAYDDNFALPGTESTHALNLLKSAFPAQAGESDTIVWQVRDGKVTDPAVQQSMTAVLDKVDKVASVTAVTSPYTPQGATQISADGKTAYATFSWAKYGLQNPRADIESVITTVHAASTADLDVELGGAAIQSVG
jgi:RND superfamily putative drug exporter